MCNNLMSFHSKELCLTSDTKVVMYKQSVKNTVDNLETPM